MFDTAMIGKKIKQARIDKNMTQMNLADAMGVSYQAVSNWERGNSMPDISKLGDLCAALDITVNDLLGIEAPVVTKAMEHEALTMEELTEVAPVLPPKMVREQLGVSMKMMHSRLQDGLEKMSQRLEQTFGEGGQFEASMEKLKDAVEKGEVTVHYRDRRKKAKKLDLSRLADLAPHLDAEYLDELIGEADLSDLDGLEELAPFLSDTTLDKLVARVPVDDLEEIVEIAPFLSTETLDNLVRRFEAVEDFEILGELAPFVSEESLDRFIDRYIEKGSEADLSDLYPFLGKEALRKLAKCMMEQKDMDALEDLMPYV